MQKIIRNLLLVSGLSIVLTAFPMKADAAADNVRVYDDAELLTDAEETQIEEYLQSLDDSINYLAVTSDSYDYGYSTDSTLEYYYTSNFTSSSNGVAFIIDMARREVYISGYGNVQKKLKNADALDITDNIYTYASAGDYQSCILKAFEQADLLINKGFIYRPMRFIVSLLISVILGFLAVFYFAMIKRRRDLSAADGAAFALLAAGSITNASSVYRTTSTPIHTVSSGDSSFGGGFSGGGGGGGFSGGGGGGGGHSGGGHSF